MNEVSTKLEYPTYAKLISIIPDDNLKKELLEKMGVEK